MCVSLNFETPGTGTRVILDLLTYYFVVIIFNAKSKILRGVTNEIQNF